MVDWQIEMIREYIKEGMLVMLTEEQWIEAASAACRAKVEAIKLYRRRGMEEAIRFLSSIPESNHEILKLMREKFVEIS